MTSFETEKVGSPVVGNEYGGGFTPVPPPLVAAPSAPQLDVQAVIELAEAVRRMWGTLSGASRGEYLKHWPTLSRAVATQQVDIDARHAMQRLIVSIGTGAFTTLGDAVRGRIFDFTGITLPGGP